MHSRKNTFIGQVYKYIVIYLLVLIFLSMMLSIIYEDYLLYAVILTCALLLIHFTYDVVIFIKMHRFVEKRRKQSRNLPVSFSDSYNWKQPSSALFESYNKKFQKGRAIYTAGSDQSSVADYEFDEITSTKYGTFISAREYISIVQIKLPRKLPNIVFDSKQTWGKQMRFSFDKNQRISLEGNFDTYFDTYFPVHYHIDLLSIITPEVMEALIRAKACDIEIYDNLLVLYAPMSISNNLADLLATGEDIAKKLMNNILTYSDTRFTSSNRYNVHASGYRILDNFLLKAFLSALTGIGLIVAVIIHIYLLSQQSIDIFTILKAIVVYPITLVAGIWSIIHAINVYTKGHKERLKRARASRY